MGQHRDDDGGRRAEQVATALGLLLLAGLIVGLVILLRG